jgi:hypothetical protein
VGLVAACPVGSEPECTEGIVKVAILTGEQDVPNVLACELPIPRFLRLEFGIEAR